MKKCFWVSLVGLVLASAVIEARQFPNPTEAQNRQYRNNPCRDPWISYGIIVASGGAATAQGRGDEGECDYTRYLSGRWSSFNELVEGIRVTRADLAKKQITYDVTPDYRAGTTTVKTLQHGVVFRTAVIGNDSGSLIGVDGGGIVAAGAGNMVAAGAGNYRVDSNDQLITLSNGHRLIIKRR